MPDTLQNVIERLRKEVERSFRARAGLEERTRHDQIEQLENRLRAEPLIRKSIDEACRQWISEQSWPRMESEAAIHVCDRFEHSVDLVAWLHQHGLRAPEKSENELLEFFLIENWECYGLKRMRSRLLGLTWEI